MWYQTANRMTFPYPLRAIFVIFVYILFMTLSLFVGSALFTAIRLFIWNKEKRGTIYLFVVQQLWSSYLKVLQFFQIYESITIEGAEKLEQVQSPLVISNHISLIDIVALGANIPHFNCVVKSSLYNQAFLGLIVRACQFIPNSGGEEFISSCKDNFASGRPLVLFPQGTRTNSNEKIKFQRGAANIVARIDNVTVVPVFIKTDSPVFTKDLPWYHLPKQVSHLQVTFGDPLLIPDEIQQEPIITKRVKKINQFLENQYSE